MRRGLILGLLILLPFPCRAEDFWKTWGDGKAELNGYRLSQPRYGEIRKGTAILIFVTEDMSRSLRVKADPGVHPQADVEPVLKLNAIRRFQTGIYDYDLMTSVFAAVGPGLPIRKVSFSAREWCGHVFHELLVDPGKIRGVFHSYFDREADGTDDLPFPAQGLLEDELPIALRGFGLQAPPEGSVPFLPSLMRSRLEHRPLAWGQAILSRRTEPGAKGSGADKTVVWTVEEAGGLTFRYRFDAAWPYRLLGWETSKGEVATLLGSTRLAYWKLNRPGGEVYLKELGLPLR